jgi:multidrug efflux pump subunit AcrA (membrane-fusion protein)
VEFRTTAAIALIFALAACGGGKNAARHLQEVETVKAARGNIASKVLFTGNIVAEDAVDVYSRADGKVSKKLLKEGDPVKKGDGILLIDRDDIGYKFKPLVVDSPIDGFVGKINVDVGTYVYERTTFTKEPIAVVVRPGPMRVKLDVPERYLETIHPGTEVTMIVDTLGGARYDGTISSSSPVVDEQTRTAKVEVEVPNTDGRLRHGMFGRINLVVEQHDGALVVPYSAISWEGEKQFAYRIVDGKAKRTEIKPGMRNDVDVEIVGGLSDGDEVAVGNLLDIEDGEKVALKAKAK